MIDMIDGISFRNVDLMDLILDQIFQISIHYM